MDWGNICVFSCPNFCNSEHEYVVVQESDDQPSEPRQIMQGDVVVKEDAKFDDVDFDDNEGGGDDDDDDDMEEEC
jgi:hypothetical protein